MPTHFMPVSPGANVTVMYNSSLVTFIRHGHSAFESQMKSLKNNRVSCTQLNAPNGMHSHEIFGYSSLDILRD